MIHENFLMNTVELRVADGSSRAGVLSVLRERRDLVRVEELAEAVGLSLSAVRFHLDRLIADGLVRTAKEPRLTPGRPRVVYQAVPEEAVDDAAAYRRLASLLATELAEHGGAGAAEHAGQVWARQTLPTQSRARAELAAPDGAPDSLVDVLSVLDNGGFSPRVIEAGWAIELNRCPFSDLMPEQSDVVCALHRGLMQSIPEIAGARTQVRLEPVPDASGPCVVRFRRSTEPADVASAG
jgi:predicted ArsR family transcriptional regulator